MISFKIIHFVPLIEKVHEPSRSLINVDVEPSTGVEADPSVTIVTTEDEPQTNPEGGIDLNNVFLSTKDCLRLLQMTTAEAVLQDVPFGPKSNVAYVINNSDNAQRKADKKLNRFWDDCGVWDTAKDAALKRTT